jgi:hypothetical protein
MKQRAHPSKPSQQYLLNLSKFFAAPDSGDTEQVLLDAGCAIDKTEQKWTVSYSGVVLDYEPATSQWSALGQVFVADALTVLEDLKTGLLRPAC